MVPWRQSASLILLARQTTATTIKNKSYFDYVTLLLKRSSKMRFAPRISTFPGGALDPYDLSPEWAEYLSSSTMSVDRFSKKTAEIYNDIDHPYPGLAFRLCAIRETFEETGFLLAKPRVSSSSVNNPVGNSLYSAVTPMPDSIANEWREKVRRDASQFMVMCKEMHVEPDVNMLFEWSEFLAPPFQKIRYDNIFYIAAMPEMLPCTIATDDEETETAEWSAPDTAMKDYRENLLQFLPPQIYELSRLANFRKLSELLEYLSKCDQNFEHRIKRMLGIFVKMSEAQVIVYDGDDRYPSDVCYDTKTIQFNGNMDDFGGIKHNRLVMKMKDSNKKWQLLNNQTNQHHPKPLSSGWEYASSKI